MRKCIQNFVRKTSREGTTWRSLACSRKEYDNEWIFQEQDAKVGLSWFRKGVNGWVFVKEFHKTEIYYPTI
jgi:hypothetical protein